VLTAFKNRPHTARSILFAREGLRLHAMVASAGFERRNELTYDWDGRKRGAAEFALFQYTLTGGGHLTFDGQHYRVTPGTAMLLYFPHDNRYWFEPDDSVDHWQHFYVCLHGTEVMRAWREAIASTGPLWNLDDNAAILRSASDICLAALDNTIRSAWHASSMAYALAMAVAEHAAPDSTRAARERPAFVDKVIDYCREHFHEDIHVDDLADIAGYSRYHFTRLFTAHEGVSPAQYLQQVRLRHAVNLLRSTDRPIKQIADACGYQDPNYFAKAFRRTFGVTPQVIRSSGMY